MFHFFVAVVMYVASLFDRLVVATSLCSPDLLLRQVDTVRRFVCQEVIQSVCDSAEEI